MELDRICQNCCYFIQSEDDFTTGYGICTEDPVFQPFLDEIFEFGDFSNCQEWYLKKRFDSQSEVCSHFEEIEIIELPEIDPYIFIKKMKEDDIGDKGRFLYDEDPTIVTNAISEISQYVLFGNESAYSALLNYYRGLGAAESLEEVHQRLNIIKVLASRDKQAELTEVFVHELYRTQSNNTTRQLYTAILDKLRHFPVDLIQEPLLELLDQKVYGLKIKNRILEVAMARDEDYYWI